MPTIKILPHAEYCPAGTSIQASAGTSLCEALLENGIAIEHACDMSCACTTCHVIVREGLASLNAADETEDEAESDPNPLLRSNAPFAGRIIPGFQNDVRRLAREPSRPRRAWYVVAV